MKRKRTGKGMGSGGEESVMKENLHHSAGCDAQEQRDRRSVALGEFRVLTDELICAILDRLTPIELGRLACVSSVMYILCNEEPLWMSMCLRIPGSLEYISSWKKTTLLRLNFLSEVLEPRANPIKFDGFDSLFLYRRWYRCCTTLEAFYRDDGYLERKETSQGCFHLDYSKLVLLTDLAENWPARKTWTIDQFSQKYGEITFRISQRSSRKITMKFKDYVSYISCQHDEDPLYIFDEKFGESAPGLLEDYAVPNFFKEDFFDILDVEQRPPYRWLIIGPERSGASWHVDPALTSAWNTLVVGRKRWALYPPGKVPVGVTVHVNEEDGDIDIETPSSLQWWLDIYPYLEEKDKPIECTQLPGETIFVPSGWWHCVLNLETTIAVTQNFVNSSNFEFVCLDFCPGHRHKGVARAGWLAIQNQAVKDSSFEDNVYGSKFSYDIEFLSKFVSDENDHYSCIWGEGNAIGQREFRAWLNRLWVVRPDLRPLIWKGACLALKADQWLARIIEICTSNNLSHPSDEEKLPVGTGSNPVYLVSDYVIKLYVEGGLASSLYSLGTELEFYGLLHKMQSPLVNHIPGIVSSGFIVQEPDGSYRDCSWSGSGMPDLVETQNLVDTSCQDSDFPFGVWGKMKSSLADDAVIRCQRVCPYLVTKRCRGDIYANLREKFSPDDNLNLASFLGVQMHHLHRVPLPKLSYDALNNDCNKGLQEHITLPKEWKPFIETMKRRKENLRSRLNQWGDPIPKTLIDNVEEYIPEDPSMLIGLFKGKNDTYTGSSPSWVHADVMDDNIHIQHVHHAPSNDDLMLDGNGGINHGACRENGMWFPAHIIDFSDLSIGDPLFDLIAIHIDVFRADSALLKKFLESYGFSDRQLKNEKNFVRPSYRAMCYCILHEDDVLGSIFSLHKELRSASSWEEVELALWGELNNFYGYHPIV